MRKGVRGLAVALTVLACSANVRAKEDVVFLQPFFWSYDFDGTDARLSGIARDPLKRRIGLSITFNCSKKWVRARVGSDDFEKTDPSLPRGSARIALGDTTITDDIWSGGAIIETTNIHQKINGAFIRRVFEITAALYHDDVRLIDIATLLKSIKRNHSFRIQESAEFYQRPEIAKFREKCATWWGSYL